MTNKPISLPKVFLGGVRTASIWRDQIIKLLRINYINPIVTNMSKEQLEKEKAQKELCDYHLYILTPAMSGYDNVAEVVSAACHDPGKTILVILPRDGELIFTEQQLKSLHKVKQIVTDEGAMVFDTLTLAVNYLNQASPIVDMDVEGDKPMPDILARKYEKDDDRNAVIFVCSGPSLTDMTTAVSICKLPRFCLNNSIKMITHFDYWYASDIQVSTVFPPWIWQHNSKKFIPDPNGEVKQYIRPYQHKKLLKFVPSIRNATLLDIGYHYDRQTFFTDDQYQMGFPYKADVEMDLAGEKVRMTTSSFLAGFRLVVEQGFNEIYFVGVDLTTPRSNFYAYDTRELTDSRYEREVARMRLVKGMLLEQAPILREMGVSVWNCNQDSNASMFPFKQLPGWKPN